MNNIILTGLMGAGKSTVGRALARQKHRPFYDSDTVIEEKTGVPISTIFEIEGEQGFREREALIIAELCELESTVIATGGGSLLRESNRKAIMNSGCVVYLKASPAQLYERIKHDKARPLMQTKSPLKTLTDILALREPYYLETANIIIPTGKQNLSYTLTQIKRYLKQIEGLCE
ncbi:MAG TPA: shikimate kinase [Thiotrichaceae bacterium]|nr:shikimate kinase [Thiotrichaceae bacterium]